MKQREQAPSAQERTSRPATSVSAASENAGFVDNRTALATQRKLTDAIDQSPRSVAQDALAMQMNKGARAVAQRNQMETASGGSANNTGLPDSLKSGVESLSGFAMDDVRVHYNSAQPAQLQAHAYAQGTDIHVGPGQERHLPHEAWHVVQQKQGRVAATMQAKGVSINDDRGLEAEADAMGARAAQIGEAGLQRKSVEDDDAHKKNLATASPMATANTAIQRVRGGMEYTEGGTTALESYPGGGAPLLTAPVNVFTVGGTQFGAYSVAPGDLAWLGAIRNTDHEVLRNGRVKLTNDVRSAEWVIEGHAVGGVTSATMIQNLTQDIATLYQLRDQLKNHVDALQGIHPGQHIVLAPAGIADLAAPGPEGLFIYRADAQSIGRAQITIQYENVDTIRRINELNASKYLTGSKIADGEDAAQVAGRPSFAQSSRDFFRTSSFATAHHTLTGGLTGASAAVVVLGATELTAANVGLIKLMVINDAMASNMTRHAAVIGQAQEKNIQRFFPKAERQTYVDAVAQANVSPAALAALRVQITGAAAAMAQLVWNNADPFALRVDETLNAMGGGPAAAIAGIRVRHSTGQATTQAERNSIKDAVLGANGVLLAAWIGQAALAYTDSTGVATDHYDGGGNGNVIRSTAGFTPVAGGGQGAVYEMREREIDMAEGDTAGIVNALTLLFNAA